ncbi:MAG: hypothetical protein E7211_18655 [Clostridium lundense]|nr:hypothetical protein [Clostridium lundense]
MDDKTGKDDVTLSALDVLKQEYGVEVSEIDMSVLEKEGYVKLSEDAFSRISASLQHLPGIVSNQTSTKTVEGAYRIVLPEGASLLQKSNGTFITAYRTPSSAGIAGQADAIPLDIASQTAASAALSVFTAASVVTGQYFMARIDSKLGSIQSVVSDIQEFLEADKDSKANANVEALLEISEDMESISGKPPLIQSNLTRIMRIKDDSLQQIDFYSGELKARIESLPDTNKKVEAEDVLARIERYLLRYLFSVRLYQEASLLELQLHGQTDPKQTERIANRLSKKSKEFKEEYRKCEDAVKRYISTVKGLGPDRLPYFLEGAKNILVSSLVLSIPFIGPFVDEKHFSNRTYELAKEYLADDRKGRHKRIEEYEKFLKRLAPENLDVIPNAIAELNQRQEIIFSPDGAFIKQTQRETATG